MTIGLAMHWPCVTDFVVYPPTPYGLKAHIRQMSTPPKLNFGHGFNFTFLSLESE